MLDLGTSAAAPEKTLDNFDIGKGTKPLILGGTFIYIYYTQFSGDIR